MPYSKDHIKTVRQRILDCAGRLFRERGYAGVGIDTIMAEAGLTRGGFYAHFKSKADLFAQMAGEPFDFANQLERLAEHPPNGVADRTAYAMSFYLNAEKRDQNAAACTMASSAVDVNRNGPAAKAAFGAQVVEVADKIAQLRVQDLKDGQPTQALSDLCLAVGALVLARASDDDTAKRILSAALQQLGD
ncbi:MAG: TetR/AcrR family transcriptional regulator [Pseudomonadota bacterium]